LASPLLRSGVGAVGSTWRFMDWRENDRICSAVLFGRPFEGKPKLEQPPPQIEHRDRIVEAPPPISKIEIIHAVEEDLRQEISVLRHDMQELRDHERIAKLEGEELRDRIAREAEDRERNISIDVVRHQLQNHGGRFLSVRDLLLEGTLSKSAIEYAISELDKTGALVWERQGSEKIYQLSQRRIL